MFKIIFIAIFLVAFSYGDDEGEVDYCNAEKLQCKKGDHIGCGSLYDFDPKLCRKWDDLEIIEFTDEEMEKIVEEHNKARNSTAGGETISGVTATRMCKMVNFKFKFF